MKVIEIKNKNGEILKTKNGEILTENILELGDRFVPQTNKTICKKGKYDSYTIPVSLIDINQKQYEKVWVKLTETMANSLLSADNKPTQTLYKVIEYKNKHGTFLGLEYLNIDNVWIKCGLETPKTIEDFKNNI